MHVLKNDLALQELQHVEVDNPGTAYLFFYERHGYHRYCGYHGYHGYHTLMISSHVADTFSEWIDHPAHFEALPRLLDEVRHHAAVAQDRHQQHN